MSRNFALFMVWYGAICCNVGWLVAVPFQIMADANAQVSDKQPAWWRRALIMAEARKKAWRAE